MKYFLHDTNSFQDEKISELFINYGYEGLGLFYTILEKIAAQEKPIKTSVLKHQLKVGKRLEKCWQFMEDLGIISSSNGETFNIRLLSYSEKYQIKKENNRKRISEYRKNQQDTKNVARYEQDCNDSKVKGSKVNVLEIHSVSDKPTPRKENLTERENVFRAEVDQFQSQYTAEMLNAFFDYWREPNKSKSKMRWEQERTWDLSLRLKKWEQNDYKFKNKRNDSVKGGTKSTTEKWQDLAQRAAAISITNAQ